MKSPLRYQMSEYDCGPTSVLNAIMYLFNREEIPPEVIRMVTQLGLDRSDCHGTIGRGGTSSNAIHFMTSWLNDYACTMHFPISCRFIENEDVNLHTDGPIDQCIESGGCVVARCLEGCDHYVTITKLDKVYVYLFDPYYCKRKFWHRGEDISFITGHPEEYNMRVARDIMDAPGYGTFSFRNSERKSAALFTRTSCRFGRRRARKEENTTTS